MEISRGGGGGGRNDPGRMTPAQRHDENPERHAGRSQGRNERRENFAAALPSMFSRRATMPMSRAVSSAWIRTPSSKLRLNRSRNATTMVSPGWTGPIRSRQPRAIHGAAAGHVGENQVLAYAVVGQQAQLRVQVLGIVVGLANPGVAVGNWEHVHGVHPDGVYRPSSR